MGGRVRLLATSMPENDRLFRTPDWTQLQWLNEPEWQVQDGALHVRTRDHTDFWRITHYGFTRDDGHVLHSPAPIKFTATVRVEGPYEVLYDQAGLMLRSDATCWVKAGVEFLQKQQLSAVVTREFSDGSVWPAGHPPFVDLKLTRRGDAVRVHARLPEGDWALLRLAYFPPDEPAVVGMYAFSLQRAGFEVRFLDFTVGPPEEDRPY